MLSARSGAPSRPPKRWHLSAAAALAKRKACSSGIASAMPDGKGAVKHVAGGKCVHRLDPRRRDMAHAAGRMVMPPASLCSAGNRDKGIGTAGEIGAGGLRIQRLAADDACRRLRGDDVRG